MDKEINQSFEEFNTLFPKIVGSNIRRYLKMYDISQAELANRLGVSQQTVSYWCNGLKVPRQAYIDDMCIQFHCTRSDLMQDHTKDMQVKEPKQLTIESYLIECNKKKLDTADILMEVQKMSSSNLSALLSYARFLNSQTDSES